MSSPRFALLSFAALAAALAAPLAAQGTPIGFEETWALSADRQKAAATLIPGTDDWYYFQCRERLDARDFASVQRLLGPWVARHARNARVIEIENRAALLGFDTDPERAFELVRERLGLSFGHQRQSASASVDLPTRLDPALLDPARLTQRALQSHPGTVDGFADRALPALLAADLSADQLHSLLARLDRPDVANLPAQIVRDLAHPQSRGFGQFPIHRLLRLPQLEECVRLQPALLQEPRFVDAMLVRLQPTVDVTWQQDPALRLAQLQRLFAFAQRLSPAFNSLKAHVLFHWLQHDLSQGAPDKERFLAYLRLPRRGGPVAETYVRRFQGKDLANLGQDFPTGLQKVGDDTALVRACLEHFFATEDAYEPYAEFLDTNWLKAVLAETKLLLGQGDAERWYSLRNDPAALEQLEKRVEIAFPPTQQTLFAAGDPVRIELDVKNVPTLLVKVFAIDAYRYLVEKQKDVDASIELDGVVPNSEETVTYQEPPLRRVRRTFDLPLLQQPGTYVVEFVGNGISSRAVIHKGALRHAVRTTAAGQSFRVYDEAGRHQQQAAIWFGGREYPADKDGEILLPFSTDAGEKKLVLKAGNRASLSRFAHAAESYELRCQAHVERESLIAGRRAKIVVRPQLTLAGRNVALQLLQDPVLTVVATDLDGLATTKEVSLGKLVDGTEVVHETIVPERLQSLTLALRGTLKDLAGKDVALVAAAPGFELNGIDRSTATKNVLLVRTPRGYSIELRGKDGEPGAGKAVKVELVHEDFRSTVQVDLASDASGRIFLGQLPRITEVRAGTDEQHGRFRLDLPDTVQPDVLTARAGTPLRIAYTGAARTPSREAFSLLARDRDAFANLALVDGFLELRDLSPGDYELRLHETGERIVVLVADGTRDDRWVIGRQRILEASDAEPLHAHVEATGDTVVVKVANASPAARVHVAATRYAPAYDLFANLAATRRRPATTAWPLAESQYEAGRTLGDEYRYVLERRFATKFPGNMLARPSLLLNPWQLDDESFNEAVGLERQTGDRFAGRPGARGPTTGGPAGSRTQADDDSGSQPNLDFLPDAAAVFAGLLPDANGEVRIPRQALRGGHLVHVLALDGDQAIRRTLVLDEQPLQPRARRLPQALDAGKALTEQQRIEFVAGGSETQLGDPRSAQVEIFDSLAAVHRALATISQDADWSKFGFVLRWPALGDAEKRALYATHACHELHFFLHAKDRAFFDAVVRPHLQHKRDKTFLDRWLLGEDLRRFVEPWAFAQLNLIERILLAQRLDGAQQQAVARLVQEQLELRPVPIERVEQLFDLAFQSNSLQEQAGAAFARKLGFVDQLAQDQRGPGDAVPPPAAKPAQAPAPTAGMPVRDGADAERARRQLQEGKADDKDAGEKREAEAITAVVESEVQERLGEELKLRGAVRRLYRAVEPTKLLVEHNWWHRRLEQTTPDVVAPSRFWADYATAPAGQPFVSAAVLQANGSFLEMMMALAVLDLPFEAGKHEITADGDRRTLRAATPLLLVRKEVAETEKADGLAPLLLGENFFRHGDRYRYENGEQRDAFVTGEFLTDVAYGCQVVVTNPTSSKRTASVLLQIPAGAVPLQKGFWTKGVTVELQPYATSQLEYHFYFPGPGSFAHYPAHAAEKGKLAAAAAPRTMTVVERPTQIDTTSWEHVSQEGTAQDVLRFLDAHNVLRLDLTKIAWRMKDPAFFAEATRKLAARHVYDDTLWSYAVLHRDPPRTREYLEHQDGFLATCGAFLDSRLVRIDPVVRRQYQHLELDPLVHQRAHRLGSERRIGNQDLARQYGQLMNVLGYKPRLDSEDWLAVTYYFLLQDRVEDALAAFAKVRPQEVQEKVQVDYLAAYLCFFTADTQQARSLAERHKDHPVAHWQQRFRSVLQQLDEIDGKAVPTTEPTGDSLAATAPSLELLLDGRTVRLQHKNLAQCEVRYFPIDVEFAFSAQPFASGGRSAAAYVQPILTQQVGLAATTAETAFEIPAQFQQRNVLVEVRAQGLVRAQTFFANALAVRFLESYGQVAVAEPGSNKPLPKTYIKVFARLQNGQVRFHKDGYTDLRGRFDYASLSDDPNAGADRYAVLVLHEQRGAVIREIEPPTR